MTLETITFCQFRNLVDNSVEFSPNVNGIVGLNAQGKTNLLEAIYYFSCARSFRGAKEREMPAWGADKASLQAHIQSGGREQTMEATVGRGKRLAVNGVALRAAREWLGFLPAVFFGPEELGLVRREAAVRRKFMDMSLCQLYPRYTKLLSDYKRLHEHKTRLLRDGLGLDALPEFEGLMCKTAEELCRFRARWTESVAPEAARFHADISGGREVLTVGYQPTFTPLTAEGMEAALQTHRQAELAARMCLIGPHRDDLPILLDGRPLKTYGSQGQTRTGALALTLAVRSWLRQELGEPPLLLLDDVFSELDEGRREYLLQHVGGGQCMITVCDGFFIGKMGHTIQIVEGRCYEPVV